MIGKGVCRLVSVAVVRCVSEVAVGRGDSVVVLAVGLQDQKSGLTNVHQKVGAFLSHKTRKWCYLL